MSVSRGVMLDFLDRVIQNWTNQLFRGGYVCFFACFWAPNKRDDFVSEPY